MKIPKRITPEQYLALVKLGMPVLAINLPHLWRDEDLVQHMLNSKYAELERKYCRDRARTGSTFYTLVDADEED